MDTGSPSSYNNDLTRDIRALGKLLFSFCWICIKIDILEKRKKIHITQNPRGEYLNDRLNSYAPVSLKFN